MRGASSGSFPGQKPHTFSSGIVPLPARTSCTRTGSSCPAAGNPSSPAAAHSRRAASRTSSLALRRCKSAMSRLTHPNPVCGDAVAAYVVAMRHALLHGDGPEAAFRAALAWARAAGAVPSVIEALRQAEDGPPVCDRESPGFVLIALRNAFHELLRAPSLEMGVVATVRRGGDTDTNAAVAGALLGAVHGRDAVPPQWRSMVLSCRPHPPRARRPRAMAYWPVDALDLAERLLVRGARGPGGAP